MKSGYLLPRKTPSTSISFYSETNIFFSVWERFPAQKVKVSAQSLRASFFETAVDKSLSDIIICAFNLKKKFDLTVSLTKRPRHVQ